MVDDVLRGLESLQQELRRDDEAHRSGGREATETKTIYVDIDPPPGFVEGPTPTPPPTATPTTGPSPTPTATPTVNPGATATPTATQGPPLGIEMYLPVIIN